MNRAFATHIPDACNPLDAVHQVYLYNLQINHPKEITDAVA
jgi:hypothetical protein